MTQRPKNLIRRSARTPNSASSMRRGESSPIQVTSTRPSAPFAGRQGVNVAAVNYYFGGKKNLYLAVLRALRTRVLEKHPMNLDGQAAQPPDERLYAFIRTLLSRILDEEEGSRFAKLMAQELIQPTDAFNQIIEDVINPSFAFLSAAVLQLFGKPMSKEKAGLCCLSIVSQIFYFYMSKTRDTQAFRQGAFRGVGN